MISSDNRHIRCADDRLTGYVVHSGNSRLREVTEHRAGSKYDMVGPKTVNKVTGILASNFKMAVVCMMRGWRVLTRTHRAIRPVVHQCINEPLNHHHRCHKLPGLLPYCNQIWYFKAPHCGNFLFVKSAY